MDDGSDADVADDLAALGSVDFEEAMASGSPERDFGERSGDDHYVLYTGGTTGMPKGVVWRQEDVFYALGGGIDAYTNERVASEWSLAEKAKAVESPLRSLNLPPLMHGAAQWGFFRFAFEGNFVVFLRKFDPHEVWRTVEREGINNLSITGDAMARPMIEALEEMGGPEALDLSSLFVLASTAAIFSPTVKDQYLELFPNLMIIDAIGSSETGRQRHAHGRQGRHAEHRRRPHRAGRPRLRRARRGPQRDRAGHRRAGPPGPPRQRARSSTTRTRRSRRPPSSPARAACATRSPATWRSTRPTAPSRCSGAGSQCINSGGEKIFPEEVEAALKAHPAVFDAIVVGVPDERWGQRVAAVVQPRDGAAPTLEELDGHCRGYVAGYKVPKELHLVPEVVRSPSGKPDYPWAGKVARGEIIRSDTTRRRHAGPGEALHRWRVGRPRRLRRHRGHLAPHRRGRRPRARGHHRRHRPGRRRPPAPPSTRASGRAWPPRSASPSSSASPTSTPPA